MRVVVAAAGTGGHINPALAIANKIKKENPDAEIIFIGTNRGLENDLVPRAGYELKKIEAYGLSKKITIKNLKHIIATIMSRKDVEKIFDSFKPDLVVGTGGYICGPVFSVATKRHIPTLLHESNAFPGKAVKAFSKKVDTILVGFKETEKLLKDAKHVVVTGTPTKIKKITISKDEKMKILSEMGIKNELPIVLIFGGSQGAQRINESVIELIKNKKNTKYQIIWAAGPKQFDEVKEKFEQSNLNINRLENVKIVPYIYNMEEMINISDLLVCRSGAMTITEISIVGKPAIFIPLPSMGANRQEDNALVLKKLGAANIILNDKVNFENLAETIDDMIEDELELKKMGEIANTIAPRDVEEKIYEEILNLLK